MVYSKEQAARDKRNLSPHAEAIAAMHLWGEDYAFKQRGGSMDFWDNLPDYKKKLCRDFVKRVREAETEEWATPLVKLSNSNTLGGGGECGSVTLKVSDLPTLPNGDHQ